MSATDVHSLIVFNYQAMAFFDVLAMLLPLSQIQAQYNSFSVKKTPFPFGTLGETGRFFCFLLLQASFLTLGPIRGLPTEGWVEVIFFDYYDTSSKRLLYYEISTFSSL